MLFLLLGFLMIGSVLVLCVKKSRESRYLLGMCISLLVQFTGILLFIAKKGGFPPEILRFLYGSLAFKTRVQYWYITLNAMGYLIALGRSLFPLFLMQMALHYSMVPVLRRNPAIKWAICLPPVVTLLVYYPAVFRLFIAPNPELRDLVVQITYFWVTCYVLVALGLLVYEFLSITMRFCRRQFSQIVVCMIALSGAVLSVRGAGPRPGLPVLQLRLRLVPRAGLSALFARRYGVHGDRRHHGGLLLFGLYQPAALHSGHLCIRAG